MCDTKQRGFIVGQWGGLSKHSDYNFKCSKHVEVLSLHLNSQWQAEQGYENCKQIAVISRTVTYPTFSWL